MAIGLGITLELESHAITAVQMTITGCSNQSFVQRMSHQTIYMVDP